VRPEWRASNHTTIVVTQRLLLQSADAPVVGIATLPLPHAQQVAIVALDSHGYLHLYTTPLGGNVVVWDPSTDGVVGGLSGAVPEGMTSSGPEGGREGAGEQDQEASAPAESGTKGQKQPDP